MDEHRHSTTGGDMIAKAKPLTTVDEIARHFQVSERTVARWIEAGCPVVRSPVGKVRRFDLDAVMAWFKGEGE